MNLIYPHVKEKPRAGLGGIGPAALMVIAVQWAIGWPRHFCINHMPINLISRCIKLIFGL